MPVLRSAIAATGTAVAGLTENKRQRNPAERQALDHLRNGKVDQALAYYRSNRRIQVATDRTRALAGMVDAWAADQSAGRDTLMLAWQRRNVASLNRLAPRWPLLRRRGPRRPPLL